ncbi:MAG: cysteine protease [Desulfuromonas sp.]|nr:MAG: cysteine protease [Desulfuromonas sp.]
MSWIKASCTLNFEIQPSTPLILMLRPRSSERQWIGRESYIMNPSVPVLEYTDLFGNLCQRLMTPSGDFSINTTVEVLVNDYLDTSTGADFVEIQHLPESVLPYLLPSRYCESDRMANQALEIVGGARPGYDQVARIEEWIMNQVRYVPGSSNVPISATEVSARGEGVCRDLAHLGIALCRSISMPARLVVGYLYGLEPMDMHAWYEVFVGGQWYTFDPTQRQAVGRRITIAFGRDAADVSVFHQFGTGILSSMDVQVELMSGPPEAV